MPFDAIERLADAADPKCRKVLEKWKKPLGSHATARFSGAESDDLMLVLKLCQFEQFYKSIYGRIVKIKKRKKKTSHSQSPS